MWKMSFFFHLFFTSMNILNVIKFRLHMCSVLLKRELNLNYICVVFLLKMSLNLNKIV